MDPCSFTPFPLPVAMRFDALPNQDSKALGVPTVFQPHGCWKASSSLSCCLSQLLGAPDYLLSCTQQIRAGCKSHRGSSIPWGTRAGKGSRRAPEAPVLVQDDEKNTGI